MSGVRRFEDLDCWNLAMDLGDLVCAVTAHGHVLEDSGFCDQIRRAADKVAPQIAEGFARYTPAQTAYCLRIAKGSLAELQTHLAKARRRKYLDEADQQRAETLAQRTVAAVTAFLKDREDAARAARTRRRPSRARPGPGANGLQRANGEGVTARGPDALRKRKMAQVPR